jgi:AAA+ ATPase superfamily predicted ATPase
VAFVGRTRELGELERQLAVVREGGLGDRGRALLIRGRRRVGKSRLVTEFVERADVPSVFFQAARHAPQAQELSAFAEAIATSNLAEADLARENTPASLTAALTLLASALPDTPSVVVIDELPWLLESLPGGAGELQRVWDRRLSAKPVLVILLGSDLTMMEQLSGHDQPFQGRATEMILEPLNPRDVQSMTKLDPMEAFDAYLITGGQPLIAREWRAGQSMMDFLRASLDTSTSGLVVSGARVLDSEFPETSLSRQVLTAIGGRGERTFTGIQRAARGEPLNAASLTASLHVLQEKRVVCADLPLSNKSAPKDRRWRIADPTLRFWLAFVEPGLSEIDRGRGDLAVARVAAGFAAWRRRAVEPVVRDALSRLLPDGDFPSVRAIGGWWPRTNIPELDLVGADKAPVADRVLFAGSIKWRDNRPFDARDLAALTGDASSVPGVAAVTPLVAVCPAGADTPGLARIWTAADLLAAWP